MNDERKSQLMEVHKEKTTEELMSIWMANDTEDWDKEALAAIEQLLKDRGKDLPLEEREEAAIEREEAALRSISKPEKPVPIGVVIGIVVGCSMPIILKNLFGLHFDGVIWMGLFAGIGIALGWGVQVLITGEKI